MSAVKRSGVCAAALSLVLLATPTVFAAADRFRAIQPREGGAPGKDPIRVSVTIREYTSTNEARAFQQAAESGGPAAIVDLLHTLNHGSILITGTEGAVLYAAHAFANDAGRRIVVVCSGPPPPGGSELTPRTERPVRVIELQVDANGRGDGRIIDAANVRLDADGFVDLDTAIAVPKPLVEVRPEK